MNSIDETRANTVTLESGDHEARMPGTLIYEYWPQITRVVEYGASADAVLSGQTPPAEGRWRGDSAGGLLGAPAPRACFPDQQPPRTLVG
jgi:hypothetical protein